MKYRFVEYQNGFVQIQKRCAWFPVWLPCDTDFSSEQTNGWGNNLWDDIEDAKRVLKYHVKRQAGKKKKRILPVDIVIREEHG